MNEATNETEAHLILRRMVPQKKKKIRDPSSSRVFNL